MALSTTGLTFHADASVDTDLWQLNVAGVMTDHPTDGESVDFFDDVEHADIVAAISGAAPVWRSGTPLMALPCLDFNPASSQTYKMRNDANSADKVLSTLITNSAFTVLVAIYAEGITTNAAAAYDNDAIIADNAAFWGIHLKNSADPHALFYNWDANEDTISLACSLNASHVLMYRHTGGNIYASVDFGSETSIASGNTGAVGGQVYIGSTTGGSKFYNGRLGAIAIWNNGDAGGDIPAAQAEFAKWLPAGGGFVPFPHPRGESGGIQRLAGGLNE